MKGLAGHASESLNSLHALAKQGTGAIADVGQVGRAVWHEIILLVRRGHAAFCNDRSRADLNAACLPFG